MGGGARFMGVRQSEPPGVSQRAGGLRSSPNSHGISLTLGSSTIPSRACVQSRACVRTQHDVRSGVLGVRWGKRGWAEEGVSLWVFLCPG